jgi:DNA repair protein RadC
MKVSEVELIYKKKQSTANAKKIDTSKIAFDILFSLWDKNKIDYVEHFYALYLNRANKVIGSILLSTGGCVGTVVDVKVLIQGAILSNAQAIVIAHNHPSGSLIPSNNDLDITSRIKTACNYFEISLLDHLIIADNQYYSFKDEGRL